MVADRASWVRMLPMILSAYRLVDARRVSVSPQEADVTLTRRVAASPAVTWEWLNDPDKRRRWVPVGGMSPDRHFRTLQAPRF